MVAMSFYKENEDLSYETDDEIIEVRRSNLRRSRNAHLFLGGLAGVVLTIAIQATFFWVIGVF